MVGMPPIPTNAEEWRAAVRSPASLAGLIFLCAVVRTWGIRNDGWSGYIISRVAFACMIGLVVSSPFRDLVNSAGNRLLRGDLSEGTTAGSDKPKREVKVSKYTWDDDGSYVRITVPIDGAEMECVSDETVETIITPLSVELRVTGRSIVYVLQIAPLNNAIDPQKSSTLVYQKTNKVVVKLNKWHDRRVWRSLIDSGKSVSDDLADRMRDIK